MLFDMRNKINGKTYEYDQGYTDGLEQGIKDGFGGGYSAGRAYLTDITHRNYEATKRRGLISNKTTFYDFIVKMREETNELVSSYDGCEFDPKELADKALVCFAMAEHYGIDLIEEMRKKTEFNEKRI